MTTWDVYAAEYADTRRGSHRPKRPCIYCGLPTVAVSGACTAHDDLPELDTHVPTLADDLVTALEAARTPGAAPGSSIRVASSAVPEPGTGFPVHGATRGLNGLTATARPSGTVLT